MVATRHDARAGRVWLVGAGPGDPELMTLKAVRVLAEADVVLVDEIPGPTGGCWRTFGQGHA